MFRSVLKIAPLLLVLASVTAFSACGDEKSAPTLTSARVGPSSPSGYYLEMTVSPSVVLFEGSATFSVRAWDINGNPASGVTIYVSGAVDTSATLTTGSNGYAAMLLDVKDRLGPESMTATLENKSVTVSYVVVPAV
ncbi:MAG: hypothetical protein ACE5EN_05270 [Nitrospinota bacterium]